MTSPRLRRSINILASLILPFALQVMWVVVYRELRPFVPEVTEFVTLLFSVAVGFGFLAYELRIYSIIVAIAYFPAMSIALIGFSLDVNGWIYHDWP